MTRSFARCCLLSLVWVPALSSRAQQYPPLKRGPVLDAKVPAANPPLHLVRGACIRYAPGQPTGLHLHPVSVVGLVTEGTFVFQPEGEPLRTIKVGDSFFEPAGRRILHFDNASSRHPATIIAYYLTDSPNTPLIELLTK